LYSLLHAGFETSHLKIYILGYTTGNDPSCRFFQLPEQSGGQFFYAKAFDKFAPIGPVLASPHIYNAAKATATLITRINREVKKNTLIRDDMVFSAERMLSWMSQSKPYSGPFRCFYTHPLSRESQFAGATIPAYTIVMTGTLLPLVYSRSLVRFLKMGI
jgi:hypothetical protein